MLICPSVAVKFADNAATTLVGLAGATWVMKSYLKETWDHTVFYPWESLNIGQPAGAGDF